LSTRTEFISVEVVIKTNHPSAEFVDWFAARGKDVTVLPWDTHRYHIYFDPAPRHTPEETIRELCQQIAALSGLPRAQWDAADFREFYVGYRTGDEPFCYAEHFSRETLLAVASVGAGIGYALYANRDGMKGADPKHAADN
jgi:hypothetical protein